MLADFNVKKEENIYEKPPYAKVKEVFHAQKTLYYKLDIFQPNTTHSFKIHNFSQKYIWKLKIFR